MLQSIRRTAEQKWLMYIVLGLLALIFAAWGAYGLVNSMAGAAAMRGGGGRKSRSESARSAWLNQQTQYQQRLGGEIPEAQKVFLQDRILESLIRERPCSRALARSGLPVSAKDVTTRRSARSLRSRLGRQILPEGARELLAAGGDHPRPPSRRNCAALCSVPRSRTAFAASDFQTPA